MSYHQRRFLPLPWRSPRDLADATGDEAAIGDKPRHLSPDDFRDPPTWTQIVLWVGIAVGFVGFLEWLRFG